MEVLVQQGKKFSIIFSKANKKFLSLNYNADNSYLFVNGKRIFKVKANKKKVNFLSHFSLVSISIGFSAADYKKVFLNGNVYDLPLDYNSIDKYDILSIRKYLMIKNNI